MTWILVPRAVFDAVKLRFKTFHCREIIEWGLRIRVKYMHWSTVDDGMRIIEDGSIPQALEP